MLRGQRGGFAMPMVILLIGFLTAGAMAAFGRAGSESRVIDNQRTEQLALMAASRGLEQHLATMGKIKAQDSTTGRFYLFAQDTASAAVVWTHVVHQASAAKDTSTFLITAEGRFRGGRDRTRPPATRTISMMAWRVGNTFNVLSAWTSLTHLKKNGNSGDITGIDAGTCPEKEGSTLAGVAAPSFDGLMGAFKGNPPVDSSYTQQSIKDKVDDMIDWRGFTDPTAPTYPLVSPDHVFCNTTSPNYIPGLAGAPASCGAFPPASSFADPDYWPVIVVNGDYSQDVSGRGILIVTGNLTVGGHSHWRGIILTGGWLRDDGVSDVEGAVMSGLNVLKGQTVGESSIGNGVKTYKYNSCAVAAAADNMGRYMRLRNTRADNRWAF